MSDNNPASQERLQLREIRRLCKLGALQPDQLTAFFVETEQARDPHANLRLRIRERLEEGEDVQILVFGHGGSGKSTELVKLAQELDDEFFTISFSVLDHLDLLSVTAAEILVIVAEQVVEKANDSGLNISDKQLQPIYDWFAKETVSFTNNVQSQLAVEAEASAGTSVLSLFAKLMASVKSELKLSTARTKSRVLELSQRPNQCPTRFSAQRSASRTAIVGYR
jgi:hypothetical protein